MMAKAQRINAVCARYQVPLKAAALQCILAHPTIASVIPGARSVAEVEENIRMVEDPIEGGANPPAMVERDGDAGQQDSHRMRKVPCLV
jgi:aryl-alcohol dehydrogenase-like predicted oxidoreductase